MDPQIGDVKLANEIGKTGRTKYVWVKCPVCKLERWAHSKLHLSPTLRLCNITPMCWFSLLDFGSPETDGHMKSHHLKRYDFTYLDNLMEKIDGDLI